jgi:hypothetical protein
MKKLAILFVISFIVFGCTVRQTGFTVLSTKHVELSRIDLKETDVARNQTGRDSRLWILFIPFGGNPTLENAVNQCLENGKGDFIINPIVDSSWWSLILFSYGSWYVTGDVGNSGSPTSQREQKMPGTTY